MRARFTKSLTDLIWLWVCTIGGMAWADGLITPLHIVAAEPLIDHQGQIMRGNSVAPGGLVHVLAADSNGEAQPPQENGQPHPNTPVVAHGESAVGRLVAPSLERSGLFGVALANPRPSTPVFVRAYSGDTIDSSYFYADSPIMTVTGTSLLYAEIGPLTNTLRAVSDTDGDGLPDWWEHQHFGGPTAADANEVGPKGLTLLQEFIAGTDPNDPEDYFIVTGITPVYADHYDEYVWVNENPDWGPIGAVYTSRVKQVEGQLVEWPSLHGRVYDLEYSTNLMTGFELLMPGLPGTPPLNVFTNETISTTHPVHYRVRVRLAE